MPYEPQWIGYYEGYAVNYLAKHHWKVARTLEFDEALHEAWLTFDKVRRRYQVEDGPHFTALFKTSWQRRFIDLANADTASRCVGYEGDEQPAQEALVGATDGDGYLLTLVRQAPREVAMVLSLFLSAPRELLALVATDSSEQVNRLLGLPAEQDTLGRVREYLSV